MKTFFSHRWYMPKFHKKSGYGWKWNTLSFLNEKKKEEKSTLGSSL